MKCVARDKDVSVWKSAESMFSEMIILGKKVSRSLKKMDVAGKLG